MILPRTSEALYLLQRLRDEAHRFAITHQRTTPPARHPERAGRGARDSATRASRRCCATSARSPRSSARRRPRSPSCRASVRSSPPRFTRTCRVDRLSATTGVVMTDASSARAGEVLIVTGMSGAGRSTAANALEDLGWYVVDNLPPQMLRPLLELTELAAGALPRVAVVVDVRGRDLFANLPEALRALRERPADPADVPRCRRTTCSSGGSRRCAGRTRCRATARSSTASGSSASDSRPCARAPTSSSTRRRCNIHQLATAGRRAVLGRGRGAAHAHAS